MILPIEKIVRLMTIARMVVFHVVVQRHAKWNFAIAFATTNIKGSWRNG